MSGKTLIADLEVSDRTRAVLSASLISTAEQFLLLTREQMREIPNCGDKTIQDVLHAYMLYTLRKSINNRLLDCTQKHVL